jgi:cell division protease FtsH
MSPNPSGPRSPGPGKGVRPSLPRPNPWRVALWIVAVVLIGSWAMRLAGVTGRGPQPISYSEFRTRLTEGEVESIEVKGEEIHGRLKEPATHGKGEDAFRFTEFVTYLPSFGDQELLSILEKQEVEVQTEPAGDGIWRMLLMSLLPILLLVAIVVMIARRMQSQGQQIFSMGKTRARLSEQRDVETTFDDVAGVEGAKTELREIIAYLKEPGRFRRLGGKPPKGVLLVGPPGTGKTLLARAVAGEAGVPFFSLTGSDFMEMFVGVGASRVRDLFRKARGTAPCIIFIDELDSIGRLRGAGLGGGHDEREQTLNQLLSEMDGFEPHESVIVMAATNRPDILDPALLRPGRFDRRVTVDAPSSNSRREILEIHARGKPLAGDVDLDEVARSTPGFSGADLENLLNEAALLAARNEKQEIGAAEVEEARDKILLGLRREGLALTKEECRLLAYHEAGHAVVAALLPNADPVHKVTIVPRGRAMGVTQQLPEKDKYVYSREYMLDRMAVMLGGRAAERLALETATSGAENDLKQATRLARRMVLEWGMSERLGHLALGGEREHVFLGEDIAQRRDYSETTAREADEEIKKILDDAYGRAETVLRENRNGLERVAEALFNEESVSGEKVLELLGLEPAEAKGETPPTEASGGSS